LNVPKDCLYSRDHFWSKPEGNEAVVGITQWAQGDLGEFVFVELPEVESEVEASSACGILESSRAVFDIMAPLSGEVLDFNPDLKESPELVNEDPYGDGWLFRITVADLDQLSTLMAPEEYGDYITDLDTEEDR